MSAGQCSAIYPPFFVSSRISYYRNKYRSIRLSIACAYTTYKVCRTHILRATWMCCALAQLRPHQTSELRRSGMSMRKLFPRRSSYSRTSTRAPRAAALLSQFTTAGRRIDEQWLGKRCSIDYRCVAQSLVPRERGRAACEAAAGGEVMARVRVEATHQPGAVANAAYAWRRGSQVPSPSRARRARISVRGIPVSHTSANDAQELGGERVHLEHGRGRRSSRSIASTSPHAPLRACARARRWANGCMGARVLILPSSNVGITSCGMRE